MQRVILIAHNVRSTHNVGSLLRTAEGLGIEKVYLTGYTPYPRHELDERLPHLARKLDGQIHKTALGAEQLIAWEHRPEIAPLLEELRGDGFQIAALEQAPTSVKIGTFHTTEPVALIVGREVEGLEPEVLALSDTILEIPMHGRKESFNVSVAAAIALYQLSAQA